MRKQLQTAVATQNKFLALSVAAEVVGSLGRTFALAWLLPPAQFGVAVALALTIAMADVFTELGLDRMIVRLRIDGNLEAQRGTLHSIALLRGLFVATALAVASPYIATGLQASDAAGAFLALALCPLIKGVTNLGPKEQARNYQYGPDGLGMMLYHGVTTVATIASALFLGTFWAATIGLVVGAICYVATTHVLALHPWRLAWQKQVALDAWHYGAPLIPNGISQGLKALGDRLIVGAILGPASLAFYNLTMMVGLLPRTIALRFLTTFFMPRFVNTASEQKSRSIAEAFAVFTGGLGLALGLLLWSVGAPLIGLLFGAVYMPPQALIGAAAALVAVRLLYSVVTLPAMAFGGTAYILIGSAGSLAGVALGAFTLWQTHSLVWFVLAMGAAELIALAIAIKRGRTALSLESPVVFATALLVPTVLMALLAVDLIMGPFGLMSRCAIALFTALSCIVLAIIGLRSAGTSFAALGSALSEAPEPSGEAGTRS